jgi:spore coat polysaccharide biosynthesis protein SpsF (cytidylyltransferase family)
MNRTGYILYGRLTSTRLPGKAMLEIDGKSIVAIARDRVRLSPAIDDIVFATSTDPIDDPLAARARDAGLPVYRGDADDVLRRLYEAAREHGLEWFLTAPLDTPVQFAEVLDATVRELRVRGLDMVYSFPGQPNGTDCYGVRTAAAGRVVAVKQATDTGAWGKYFTDTGLFTWGEVNLFAAHPHLKDFRLTIDYPEDFAFLTRLYADLVQRHGEAFSLNDLIAALERPEYQRELGWMRELEARWAQHFSRTGSPVDADVARIRAQHTEGVPHAG